MNKIVLILVGLPGSGKTTASDFFKTRKIPVVRMGDVTDRALRKANLSQTEENEKTIRESLRKKYGEDIYARKSTLEITSQFKNHPLVVIDGMRGEEELKFFKKAFPLIKTVFIEAGEKIRYLRLSERKLRPLTVLEAKQRDLSELSQLGLYTLRKSADFVVENEGKKDEFYKKLNNLLTKIAQ